MSQPAPPTSPANPVTHAVRIGVFDSGVGGLSVLRALHEALPQASLLYAADSAFAPYGERSEAEILERSDTLANFLRNEGAQLLVIACNTATAAAVQHLRAVHPAWPIVGVEPGIKPAIARSANRRVGVLATTGTLRSEKFQRLLQAHGQGATVIAQPCPGLAAAIEQDRLDDPHLLQLVERYCEPLRAQAVDTVVLGCTHYPFIEPQIRATLGPGVQIIDTAEAVARQAAALASTLPAHPPTEPVRLWTSGDPQRLADFAARWLALPFQAARLPEHARQLPRHAPPVESQGSEPA